MNIRDSSGRADRVLAVAATVIAVVSVAVSVLDHIDTREANRLSLRPSLSLSRVRYSSPDLQELGIWVNNNGAGPAIITKMRIIIDGKVMEGSDLEPWKSALAELGIDGGWIRFFVFDPGDAIGPGQREALIWNLPNPVDRSHLKQFSDAIERVSLSISYESVYKERFERTLGPVSK